MIRRHPPHAVNLDQETAMTEDRLRSGRFHATIGHSYRKDLLGHLHLL
ncbi:MAG: hypothetical protein H6595_08605 [Flavobacteriales bacterium]|nr:hypothetical protein [Flavobacteriales bacterium]MCB9167527.1 hypothetical protein [Flavobacteriales bacterium]